MKISDFDKSIIIGYSKESGWNIIFRDSEDDPVSPKDVGLVKRILDFEYQKHFRQIRKA